MSDTQTQEELRREIEQTRRELGATVEQLARKADVKAKLQERKAHVQEQVRQSPLPVGAVAAGIALVLVALWLKKRRGP